MSTRVQIPMKTAPAPARCLTPASAGILQRQCACGGSGGPGGECAQCKKKNLQRRADGAGPDNTPPIVHQVLRSPGQPLDAQTRAYFEPRFGHDFSKVRIHTDARAAESARAVDAFAYTVGRDIVFGRGQYVPTNSSGRRLLAHELTHVTQQAASSSNTLLSIGAPMGRYEREAEQTANSLLPPSCNESSSVGVDRGTSSPKGTSSIAPPGIIQRQLLTPGLQGGGFAGIYEREQRSAFSHIYPPGWRPTMQTVKVWFNTFIPMAKIDGPPLHDCFTGDGRGFSNAIHASSRTHQEIEFDVTTFAKTIDWKQTGTSHEVDCKTGAIEHTGKAPEGELTNGDVVPDPPTGQITLRFIVSATNPLVTPAPAIDADVVFHVDPVHRRCGLTGEHDGFPAYEAYVTADGGAGKTVYTYDPRTAGEGISALFPPMDKVASGSTTF